MFSFIEIEGIWKAEEVFDSPVTPNISAGVYNSTKWRCQRSKDRKDGLGGETKNNENQRILFLRREWEKKVCVMICNFIH